MKLVLRCKVEYASYKIIYSEGNIKYWWNLSIKIVIKRKNNKLDFIIGNHSHKKRKDSLEGSLDRVLFAAELEFPKILVPRLPQHTSDVNIECAGKSEWSKQQCSLHVTSFLEH